MGEMINIMQVNTQSFVELTTYLNMIWSAPFQIIVCSILLWRYLGVASLAGLATLILFIPVNAWLSNKSKVLQAKKLKFQDSRMKLLNEIFNGIKVLKLYGWEPSFQNIINKIRENELGVFFKLNIYQVLINFCIGIASFLVRFIPFISVLHISGLLN
jgi:ABC-type bacteriocin/lantibiotic exporter with double-glycine peptidase domain